MAEYRLAPPGDPRCQSAAYAEHLPQQSYVGSAVHLPRLQAAANLAVDLVLRDGLGSIVDLGCADGGLQTLIAERLPDIPMWGYDASRHSVAHALPGANVRFADFLTEDLPMGELAIATEVIEHLDDPAGFLRMLHARPEIRHLILSSPHHETAAWHEPNHVWAWDRIGYWKLVNDSPWRVESQSTVTWSQFIVATR